jgi:hypothetical protein
MLAVTNLRHSFRHNMPRQAKNKPSWEIGLQGAVKEGRRGWSVVNFRGKTRLRLQFPKQGNWPADAQAFLPYPWERTSVNPVIQLVNAIYPRVMSGEVTLRAAIADAVATKTTPAAAVVSPWPAIEEAFKRDLMEYGNQIKAKTYEGSYGRYLEIALLHLQGRKQAQNGFELVDATLRHERTHQGRGKRNGETLATWMNQPASRHDCCLALKTFLDFAVHEHHQPQCWLVSARDYTKLRGTQRKRREKAYLTDEECLALFELLEKDNPSNPGWANVARLMRVYGIRMWETNCLVVKPDPKGQLRLFVTVGKVYATRGTKRANDPRWLAPVPVAGQIFDLVGAVNRGELDLPTNKQGELVDVDGRNLGNRLRQLPLWRDLEAKYAAQGEWLRPYSFRDSWSHEAGRYGMSDHNICRAMGNTPEVRNRNYRTTSFESMADDWSKVEQSIEVAS